VIPERAEALGVEAFTSYRAMLDRAGLDLVSICTPNHLHWGMATEAVRRGLDAIVEKPVAIGVPDVRERTLASHVFPVMQVRENLAVKALLAAVPYLGRIYSCALVQRWSRNMAYYQASPWRGKVAEAGGSLYTQGVHYVDVMTQAMGPVAEVGARMATLTHAVEVEDELVAAFEFEGGALGTLNFSLNESANRTAGLRVTGTEGYASVGGPAMNEVLGWEVPGMDWDEVWTLPETPNSYGGAYQGSPANHAAIYANVADHLLRGAPITHTLESVLPALDFIERAYKAAGR
jgi:UDP-N-acetyl-2-amino-2-deoxyglucuronate dehydrogenase